MLFFSNSNQTVLQLHCRDGNKSCCAHLIASSNPLLSDDDFLIMEILIRGSFGVQTAGWHSLRGGGGGGGGVGDVSGSTAGAELFGTVDVLEEVGQTRRRHGAKTSWLVYTVIACSRMLWFHRRTIFASVAKCLVLIPVLLFLLVRFSPTSESHVCEVYICAACALKSKWPKQRGWHKRRRQV